MPFGAMAKHFFHKEFNFDSHCGCGAFFQPRSGGDLKRVVIAHPPPHPGSFLHTSKSLRPLWKGLRPDATSCPSKQPCQQNYYYNAPCKAKCNTCNNAKMQNLLCIVFQSASAGYDSMKISEGKLSQGKTLQVNSQGKHLKKNI